MAQKADIAVIGLAVMGQNLIMDIDSKGFVVCVYNQSVDKVTHFLNNKAKGTKVIGATSLEDMVNKLKTPRKIMLLVKAGSDVDDVIKNITPLLSSGDLIIDCANSEYQDTTRRCDELKNKCILFVGSGVSYGGEGAQYGPLLMPGGHKEAWPLIKDIFQSIAAKAYKEPCCDWVGEGGAGHLVKMIHNGIEYAEKQLLFEAYGLMKVLGMTQMEIAKEMDQWNEDDTAGQEGTEKGTASAALHYSVPVTLTGEAFFSRYLSVLDKHVNASKHLNVLERKMPIQNKTDFLTHIKHALYCAKIASYAHCFMVMREITLDLHWNLNYGGIALMWRGGCIIFSVLLRNIKEAFERNPQLTNLLLDDFFKNAINHSQESWRQIISHSVLWGVPVPAMSAALAFYDGYRTERLPPNLLHAHFFVAYTYKLLGEEGQFVHTNSTVKRDDTEIEHKAETDIDENEDSEKYEICFTDSEEDEKNEEGFFINAEVEKWLKNYHQNKHNTINQKRDITFPAKAEEFLPLSGGYVTKSFPPLKLVFYEFRNAQTFVYIAMDTIKFLIVKKNGRLRNICITVVPLNGEDYQEELVKLIKQTGINFSCPYRKGVDVDICDWNTLYMLANLNTTLRIRISGGGTGHFSHVATHQYNKSRDENNASCFLHKNETVSPFTLGIIDTGSVHPTIFGIYGVNMNENY